LDAARFTNWRPNGQGNGDTETGTPFEQLGRMRARRFARRQ
jgi:hypothetical protein